MRIRSTAAALVVAVATFGPAGPSVLAAAFTVSPGLSGSVKDELGKAIEGVEVLVLAPEGQGNDALIRAVSDAGGRFIVSSIAPGVYRIAAIKSGYIAALGRVNTQLRSSVELVLRPVPKPGQPGAESVLPDMSWTLRVPPRSILRELKAGSTVAAGDTGGVRAFATRVQDAVRGEVDHVFAVGSWRAGSSGPASNLAGNETRMRFAGALGEHGAIQVHGRRGSLDSSSSPEAATAVSRGASDVDLDVSYDTSVDTNLAMRAFYSTGELFVDDRPGVAGSGARQSQRSFGYDATWRKQVDASSSVAVAVGFQDVNLDSGQAVAPGWDVASGDAWNRAIGAEGSYKNLVGDGHLVRLGVRAQRLSLEAPAVRAGSDNGGIVLDGAIGWNVLIDTEDRWTIAGPFAMTYGLAVRQGFEGSEPTALTPRVGGSWTSGRSQARAAVSYLAESHTGRSAASAAMVSDRRSPYGYQFDWTTRLDPSSTLRGTASYVPSRADLWGGPGIDREFQSLYVSDGMSSDRFVAVDLERAAASATIGFRVARGRAEGVLAPALDDEPVVLISDRVLDYDAARISVGVPRAGSAVSFGYRAMQVRASAPGAPTEDPVRTLGLEFIQDLVHFASGRASCRLLMTARTALRTGTAVSEAESADAQRFVAEQKRFGAGVSLAF